MIVAQCLQLLWMRQKTEEEIAKRAIRGLRGSGKKQAKKRNDFVVIQCLTTGVVAKLSLDQMGHKIRTRVGASIGNGSCEVLAELG